MRLTHPRGSCTIKVESFYWQNIEIKSNWSPTLSRICPEIDKWFVSWKFVSTSTSSLANKKVSTVQLISVHRSLANQLCLLFKTCVSSFQLFICFHFVDIDRRNKCVKTEYFSLSTDQVFCFNKFGASSFWLNIMNC